MECRDMQQYLPFLGDGSIAPDIEREINSHLESCGSCRAAYDRMRHMFALVQTAYGETSSDDDILASVRRGIDHRIRERRTFRYLFSAAAAVILAVSFYFAVGFEHTRNRANEVANAGADYYDYLAEQYLSTYDLLAVADDIPASGEMDISADMALEMGYLEITVNDIIENVGEEQLGEMLHQTYF